MSRRRRKKFLKPLHLNGAILAHERLGNKSDQVEMEILPTILVTYDMSEAKTFMVLARPYAVSGTFWCISAFSTSPLAAAEALWGGIQHCCNRFTI